MHVDSFSDVGKEDERDLGFQKVPMSPTLKPELDESPQCCTTDEHRLYQQLIGISQCGLYWIYALQSHLLADSCQHLDKAT
jgi:hypothetical protein